jgi:phosphoenolpyruvate-protein phosphotransferase (PTS system enzyme I)
LTEERIHGLSASTGFAVGLATLVLDVEHAVHKQLPAAEEAMALRNAITNARQDIANLIQSLSIDGADILGFQQAMLEDEVLTEKVWPSIASGISAEFAWRMALDHEISHYKDSNDEHFAARIADLCDIRDRVLAHLFGTEPSANLGSGEILVGDDILPSTFLSKDWSGGGGLVLGSGSSLSHVAMLARARSVPMIVGIGDRWKKLSGQIVVNGDAAHVTVNPLPETIADARHKASESVGQRGSSKGLAHEPAITVDGTRIALLINVASMADISDFEPAFCDGVGLARTEFLVGSALRDEDQQYHIYAELLLWAGGKPVTIRTVDAGGDKPVAGYTVDGEANSFLGMRGIRLSLAHPEIFKIQLRALLRAAALGTVKIMLPMVTLPADLQTTRQLMEQCRSDLALEGFAFGNPQLGIMVEVPAVALSPQTFDADFFSIGSNDLTQYATAAARDNSAVASYADALHLGVMFMIAHVAQHGHLHGKEVSLCGDAAADPLIIEALLKAGVRSLSVPPGLVASTKAAVRRASLSTGSPRHE